MEALQAAWNVRHKPAKGYGHLFFMTKTGGSFEKRSTRYLTEQFRKFVEPLGLYRKGGGFYALRHVFETVGGECRDQVAVDAIMGHERDDMASNYRERDRVQAVHGRFASACPEPVRSDNRWLSAVHEAEHAVVAIL